MKVGTYITKQHTGRTAIQGCGKLRVWDSPCCPSQAPPIPKKQRVIGGKESLALSRPLATTTRRIGRKSKSIGRAEPSGPKSQGRNGWTLECTRHGHVRVGIGGRALWWILLPVTVLVTVYPPATSTYLPYVVPAVPLVGGYDARANLARDATPSSSAFATSLRPQCDTKGAPDHQIREPVESTEPYLCNDRQTSHIRQDRQPGPRMLTSLHISTPYRCYPASVVPLLVHLLTRLSPLPVSSSWNCE